LILQALHNIEPVTETYPFSDSNNELNRLRKGKAHYPGGVKARTVDNKKPGLTGPVLIG